MAELEAIADTLKASKIKFSISGTEYRIAVERFYAEEKILGSLISASFSSVRTRSRP
jgi:hypothetical protein